MQMADDLVQGRVSAVARELLCQGQEKKQSVSRVEVTSLFVVAETELVLMLEAVVVSPSGTYRGKTELDTGSAGCA
jgi:hypothetical protein